MTKTERLLREIRQSKYGMTHREIVQFVLDMMYGFGTVSYKRKHDRGLWSARLYGTRERTGILERFCTQDWATGRWKVNRKIEGPFTKKRSNLDHRFY